MLRGSRARFPKASTGGDAGEPCGGRDWPGLHSLQKPDSPAAFPDSRSGHAAAGLEGKRDGPADCRRRRAEPPLSSGVKVPLRSENPMGQFQPSVEPSTVWLRGLVEAMDEVASSAAQPPATDRKALVNRLELPAMQARQTAFPDTGPRPRPPKCKPAARSHEKHPAGSKLATTG